MSEASVPSAGMYIPAFVYLLLYNINTTTETICKRLTGCRCGRRSRLLHVGIEIGYSRLWSILVYLVKIIRVIRSQWRPDLSPSPIIGRHGNYKTLNLQNVPRFLLRKNYPCIDISQLVYSINVACTCTYANLPNSVPPVSWSWVYIMKSLNIEFEPPCIEWRLILKPHSQLFIHAINMATYTLANRTTRNLTAPMQWI